MILWAKECFAFVHSALAVKQTSPLKLKDTRKIIFYENLKFSVQLLPYGLDLKRSEKVFSSSITVYLASCKYCNEKYFERRKIGKEFKAVI